MHCSHHNKKTSLPFFPGFEASLCIRIRRLIKPADSVPQNDLKCSVTCVRLKEIVPLKIIGKLVFIDENPLTNEHKQHAVSGRPAADSQRPKAVFWSQSLISILIGQCFCQLLFKLTLESLCLK